MDITSANTVIMLAVANVFPAPVKLQQFAAEDIFDTEDTAPAEVGMGVDGHLFAGVILTPTLQTFTFSPDSPSCPLFDLWNQLQIAGKSLLPANAEILMPSLSQSWTMTNGVLSRFKPMPQAKKVLQPRQFQITWESASPAPI
jgi:hypothetical protein